MLTLIDLPDLVLRQIFREVGDFQSLFNISLVCKRFSTLAISDSLVREVTIEKDGHVPGFGKVLDFSSFFLRFKRVSSVNVNTAGSYW